MHSNYRITFSFTFLSRNSIFLNAQSQNSECFQKKIAHFCKFIFHSDSSKRFIGSQRLMRLKGLFQGTKFQKMKKRFFFGQLYQLRKSSLELTADKVFIIHLCLDNNPEKKCVRNECRYRDFLGKLRMIIFIHHFSNYLFLRNLNY